MDFWGIQCVFFLSQYVQEVMGFIGDYTYLLSEEVYI